jgi:hypothetical protein
MKDQFARRRTEQAAVLPYGAGKQGAARWPSSVIAQRKTAATKLSERQFIRAYLALFLVPARADGSKIASLACFGTYEVRLIEFPEDARADVPLLWVELYRHDTCTGLDSFCCDDFDEAVMAADNFMLRAKTLYEQGASATREKLAQNIMERLRDAGFDCNLLGEVGDNASPPA